MAIVSEFMKYLKFEQIDDFIMTDSNSLDLAFNQWMWYNVGNGDNMYITSGIVLAILVIIWMGSRTDI